MSKENKGGCCGGKHKKKFDKDGRRLTISNKDSKKKIKKHKGFMAVEAKVVLLGESGVGKTALSTKFSEGTFPENTSVTLGGSYCKKECVLDSGNTVILHIWDTAGSENSRAMLPLYYRDSSGGLITYDIGSRKSFESINYWVKELTQKLTPGTYKIAIIGNKCDLPEEEREVSHEEASQFAKDNGFLFSEVSAKTGEGVVRIFEELSEKIFQMKSD
ncbi:unnamed protein product [Moneuplotes crassus]|uniref:Uncharacterized protein n=1 Tax=Euplotes crassus TaxID=5936 RepID=A0AAD1XV53_EUPCR|nr:unnamed protein product [Moneuplotes crassus]